MRIGSICIECFYLKAYPGNWLRVRCDKNKFKEILSISHPFVTLPRACPNFDEDLPEGNNIGGTGESVVE
jgi:hypothetical protein